MVSMNALASNLLHASCAVIICVYRAYLGLFWNHGYRCGAAGSVLGTLVDGAVVGKVDGSTLGDRVLVGIDGGPTLGYSAIVGICDGPIGSDVVRALVGSDVASTCSYPT